MPWVLGLLARDLAWRVPRAAAWALAGAVILLSGCTVIGGGGLLIAGQVQVVAPGAAQPTPTLPSGNPIVPAPPTPTLAPAPPPSDRVEAVIAAAMTWRGVSRCVPVWLATVSVWTLAPSFSTVYSGINDGAGIAGGRGSLGLSG